MMIMITNDSKDKKGSEMALGNHSAAFIIVIIKYVRIL